jgi:murein DD-endopeptidase MepM/ murein hydrolase activator NlpD
MARLSRLLVLVSAATAVLTIGMLVGSRQADPVRFGSPPAQVERRSSLPAREAEAAPAAAAREPDRANEETGVSPLDDLRARLLALPVQGTRPDQLVSSFGDARGSGPHEAIDILAPIGTPVLAVEDGRIEKLFVSVRGGLTIYHFDPRRRYAYYYAHLSRYAEGLKEGDDVARGDVIGYVGVSGNAPPDTPHLHFAIFELGPERQWWKGAPIDPYLVWHPDAE